MSTAEFGYPPEKLLIQVEDEWREQLGEERFAQLKGILVDVWKSPLVRL